VGEFLRIALTGDQRTKDRHTQPGLTADQLQAIILTSQYQMARDRGSGPSIQGGVWDGGENAVGLDIWSSD
jgi:hypothetical protein